MFNPAASVGIETATIRIISNDPNGPLVDLSATGLLGTAMLATAIADGGDLGSVCLGSFAQEELTINNPGSCSLSISNITSSSPEFTTPNVHSFPLVVNAGGSIDLVVRFNPSSFGAKSATICALPGAESRAHEVAYREVDYRYAADRR